ncbi:MAG: YadA family autotransporter adhesin [Dyella sp.]|uniref:YadA family autotransporter adhesin n=1 Tax=Dyella sp. TaxID=1869338 RepID=UPI003F7F046F
MNTIYRIVFNANTGKWVVASELAKGRKKKASTVASIAAAVALGLGFGGNAAIAQSTEVVGTSCTAANGQTGTVDAAGQCDTDASAMIQTRSVGILASLTVGGGTAGGLNAIAIGAQSNASGAGSIAISNSLDSGGTPAVASNYNSIAIGTGTTSTQWASVAVGWRANAIGAYSVGLGSQAMASGDYAVGLGSQAHANAAYAVALGNQANAASGINAIAIGSTSNASGTNTLALGANAKAINPNAGYSATAIGVNATANAYSALVVGESSTATATGASTFGHHSSAAGQEGVALGGYVTASGDYSIATGYNANASAVGSVAIGNAATATAASSVALGDGAVADAANTVSVGSSTAQRKIVNMAAGTISATSTDAVNASQLYATANSVATALGGSSNVAADGTVSKPSYALTDSFDADGKPVTSNYTSVGAALAQVDGRVATNTTSISTLQSQVSSGSIGLVQQANATSNLTVAKDTGGTVVDFTGKDTAGAAQARVLTGVGAGQVSNVSADAVNGSQLYATANSVASALGGEASVNTDGTIKAPTYTLTESFDANGDPVTKDYSSVGDALAQVDGRVATNSSSITTINNTLDDLTSGTAGLVQQAAKGANLTVGKDIDGDKVDFTGKNLTTNEAQTRVLTGVGAGQVSNVSADAVNGSQLYATANSIADAIGGGAKVDTDGTITAPTYTLTTGTDSNGDPITKDYTSIGDAFTQIDGRVAQNSTDITTINTTLDGISNGTVGLVQQADAAGAITVGAGSGGSTVNIGGTGGARVLSGVANGTADTDAATIAQLKAAGLVDPEGKPLAAVVYDSLTLDKATLGGSKGTILDNLAGGLIASGSMQAVNGGQLYTMQQTFQSKFDQLNSQYTSLDGRVTTIEQNGGGGGGGGGTPGYGPGSGTGDNSLVIGSGADASGDNSSAIGNDSVAAGKGSTATGNGANAGGDNSTAIGSGAKASGNNGTAVGSNSNASGSNSTAIGSGSTATGNNSVAIGNGSVADRDNSVSVGSAGNERQITNVAAGTARTDAANWGQVQDAVNGVQDWANQKFHQVDRRINRMGAMSAAYGQMAFSAQGINTPNKVGVGVGMQGGQSAIAVGYSRQLKPNLNVSFGGSASAGEVSVGAGMSLGW